MGSQAVNNGPIPGLQVIITKKVLEHACKIHNKLSEESKDQDRAEHIHSLLWLLKECGVQDTFGIVDVHNHFDVPCGFHLVTKIEGHQAGKTCISTQLAQDEDLKSRELCGHKFAYIPGLGWYAYEFRLGTLLDTNEAYTKFISRFSKYLDKHNITSLGLEYTIPQLSEIQVYETVSKTQQKMDLKEFSEFSELPNGLRWVPTCWRWSSKSEDTMSPMVFCGIDPDTGDHDPPKPDPPKPKDLINNVYPILGQLSLP
uniref:Uncharacterized protein n=1 Tax=Gibberella zeae TaxID=5518 RepID=A0A4E9ELG4_GIBZA